MSRAPACVQADYPVSRLTTVGTGGPARWFARPERPAPPWTRCCSGREAEGLEIAVVGLGSNLLVADEGYDGVVLRLAGELARIARDGERIVCGGGAHARGGRQAARPAGAWPGIEFGCAIPGTAGGAVRMNAGAYGGEMRDVLEAAVVVGAAGERRGGPAQLDMTYRHSNLAPGEVVAEAVLRLRRDDPRRDPRHRRRDAAPPARGPARQGADVRRRCGRTPTASCSAGRLLEECGLKGFVVGRRPHLAGARELHREHRRRPLGRRGRADGRGPPPRARAVRDRARARGADARPDRASAFGLTGQDPPAVRRTGWTCQRPTSTPRWCCAGARFAAPRAGAGWRCSRGRSRCCSCPRATGGSSTPPSSRSRG